MGDGKRAEHVREGLIHRVKEGSINDRHAIGKALLRRAGRDAEARCGREVAVGEIFLERVPAVAAVQRTPKGDGGAVLHDKRSSVAVAGAERRKENLEGNATPALVDTEGREAHSLRVIVAERCHAQRLSRAEGWLWNFRSAARSACRVLRRGQRAGREPCGRLDEDVRNRLLVEEAVEEEERNHPCEEENENDDDGAEAHKGLSDVNTLGKKSVHDVNRSVSW